MKAKGIIYLILTFIFTSILCYISYQGFGQGHILSFRNIDLGLDLNGGAYIVYEADAGNPSEDEMSAAISMLQNRLDSKGWTEAIVYQEGEKRIRLEIPGVDNIEEVLDEIGQTAKLSFKNENWEDVVSGENVINAKKMTYTDSFGAQQIVVSLEFDQQGTEDFKIATEENLNKTLFIVLDDTIISAPTVNAVIEDGNVIIEGNFDINSAEELASLIRAGSLPFNLNVLEVNTVGATLGSNALKTSVFAGFIGILAIILFMLIFYRVSGLAACIALIIYIALELIVLNGLNVTLTLPGISGIILSIGMAVDANVIIFERIKEELALGRTVKLSVINGFSRAFSAILDSNITTLIAGIILYWLGSGPVKGFAQTLMIGIIISMFTALFVTKFIINSLVSFGIKNSKFYGGK